MGFKLLRCGPYANESERKATEKLTAHLKGNYSAIPWTLLTNLPFSMGGQRLSDELDMVSLSAYGVHVIEIKHWDAAFMRQYPDLVEAEAEKINDKAKRVASVLRRQFGDVGFVVPKLLLTRGESEKYATAPGFPRRERGVDVHGLSEWRALLGVEAANPPIQLTQDQINSAAQLLAPRAVASDLGDAEHAGFRAFGNYIDLSPLLISGADNEAFHRTFRALRRQSRDRVILHVYDVTAVRDKNPEEVARREFTVLQKLQKSRFLPSLLDSFQEVPGYSGEMFFFSYIDAEAASLAARTSDPNWTVDDRIHTARRCMEALEELHETSGFVDGFVLHRNLTPETIRVRTTGEPLLTGLHLARIAGQETVTGRVKTPDSAWTAPEIKQNGLAAGGTASEVYGLCASLQVLFATPAQTGDAAAQTAYDTLAAGLHADPTQRPTLRTLLADFTFPADAPSAPVDAKEANLPVEFWDEDTVQVLNNRAYRVVSRLGSGAFGTTFKVVEVDASHPNVERSGPYVAKAITHADGADAADAYARVRPQSVNGHLAQVFEVRNPWQPNTLTALLQWLPGDSIEMWRGILPLLLEETGGAQPLPQTAETVALRWLRDLCDGLSALHRVGLVHGDISPRNIIVGEECIALTDYDLTQRAGEPALGGTLQYSSPGVDARAAVSPPDDMWALAASFFDVLFDRPPFQFLNGLQKNRSLAWNTGDREAWPRLAAFLDQAVPAMPAVTDDAMPRFVDAVAARQFLDDLLVLPPTPPADLTDAATLPVTLLVPLPMAREPLEDVQLTPNEVPWLGDLLRSYAASPKGNAETRGLDSLFARQTYVETALDEQLARSIEADALSLVLLCGNAGDGKTAFLQNLAHRLGLEAGSSANRLWDHMLPNGVRLVANLDGSASFQGQTAKELLDQFFAPFQDGGFPTKLVHLIAINDGPLLSWLDDAEDGPLKTQLLGILDNEFGDTSPFGGAERIRFVDLNVRSLVGGVEQGSGTLSTEFLDALIGKMLNGESDTSGQEADKWQPCLTCTAQKRCPAWRSVHTLRDKAVGPVMRARLARALQAVHQRGETHITARALRGALGYLLFGWHYCLDLHENPADLPPHFWDRAFDGTLPYRQGDLLSELEELDPALEAHPRIDRVLLRGGLGNSNPEETRGASNAETLPSLASLRRRAYFEWTNEKIADVGGSRAALDLARGRHLADFLRVGVGSKEECEAVCSALCDGISRLENLPPQAFAADQVPLKISPRTPTESAFWVTKERSRFSLRPSLPTRRAVGLETLHTHVIFSYTFLDGRREDLLVGAELFHLLMEMRDGYQLSDARSDDVFANLSVFKQRLAQEEGRVLYGWNPLDTDDRVFVIRARFHEGRQQLLIAPKEPALEAIEKEIAKA